MRNALEGSGEARSLKLMGSQLTIGISSGKATGSGDSLPSSSDGPDAVPDAETNCLSHALALTPAPGLPVTQSPRALCADHETKHRWREFTTSDPVRSDARHS